MGKDLNKKIAKFMELDFNKNYYETYINNL